MSRPPSPCLPAARLSHARLRLLWWAAAGRAGSPEVPADCLPASQGSPFFLPGPIDLPLVRERQGRRAQEALPKQGGRKASPAKRPPPPSKRRLCPVASRDAGTPGQEGGPYGGRSACLGFGFRKERAQMLGPQGTSPCRTPPAALVEPGARQAQRQEEGAGGRTGRSQGERQEAPPEARQELRRSRSDHQFPERVAKGPARRSPWPGRGRVLGRLRTPPPPGWPPRDQARLAFLA